MGKSLLIGKAKLLFRHIFNRETRCNWLESNQMLTPDRRVKTPSLVTMANNAVEKTSNKHKNSLELPGTATYFKSGVSSGWSPLMV